MAILAADGAPCPPGYVIRDGYCVPDGQPATTPGSSAWVWPVALAAMAAGGVAAWGARIQQSRRKEHAHGHHH